MTGPEPADVVTAAEALRPLLDISDSDPRWAATALPTAWSAQHTLEHITDALLFYAGQIARRADRRLPVLRDGRRSSPSEHIDNALSGACILAALLRDLGADRAWHPSGDADATGWAGMAITELLVHGHDVAQCLQLPLDPPKEVCARTVARVFPWVPLTVTEPQLLLLAVTGRVEVPGVHNDPDWWWQSAPLDEWDGRPRRRTTAPAWR